MFLTSPPSAADRLLISLGVLWDPPLKSVVAKKLWHKVSCKERNGHRLRVQVDMLYVVESFRSALDTPEISLAFATRTSRLEIVGRFGYSPSQGSDALNPKQHESHNRLHPSKQWKYCTFICGRPFLRGVLQILSFGLRLSL